jgi:hypothetical protein
MILSNLGISASSAREPIITDNLLVHLDAGNVNSYLGTGSTWTDLQGNANGTLVNGLTYSSNNRGSLETNGSNDYVLILSVAGSGTATQSFTYEVWVNPSDSDSDGNILSMSNSNPQNNWNMPPISAVSGSFRAKIWQNTQLVADTTFAQGEWYQVVLVWDYVASTQLLYVNGILNDSQGGIIYESSGVNNNIFLGQANPGADNAGDFAGKYSIVRLYNKALSSAEVLINYNVNSSRY